MARDIGKKDEADHWADEAETIREKIVDRLYDERDAAFYDVDAQNQFVRIRGDVITRVLGEHVVDQKLFDAVYQEQIHNPAAFWAPYPLPSTALNDPSFGRPIPRNSWGGASQALTALRTPRWMEHYGRPADLAHLMQQWIVALLRTTAFRQQMDPISGVFTEDAPGYSPAALVFLDFTWRLHGVRMCGDQIAWNIRPWDQGHRAAFRLRVNPTTIAELKYASDRAELRLNGRLLLRIRNTVRLVTTRDGLLREATGIADQRATIALEGHGQKPKTFSIEPNEKIDLTNLRGDRAGQSQCDRRGLDS